MGPLDSLLRLDQVVGGVQSGGPGWGPPFTAHTHTHRKRFVEPYIIHLIYRKYIYLYYTQAVMLREGRDTQTRAVGTRGRGVSHQGAALGDGWTSPSSHKLLGGVFPLPAP